MGPQYTDIVTPSGYVLRVTYDVTVGDLLITLAIGLLIITYLIHIFTKMWWR